MWDKRAQVASVHDGDTLNVVLDQGFGQTTEISLRLLGVYAPELSEPNGKDAAEFVQSWLSALPSAKWPVIVTTVRGPRSGNEVKTLGRYVGVLESIDHAHNLNVAAEAYYRRKGFASGMGKP